VLRTITALCVVSLATPTALAEDELTEIAAVHEACEGAREGLRTPLYVMRVEYRLGRYDDEDARLYVNTRRNLRALEGHVSLLLSGLEPIAFEVPDEAVSALRSAASRGAVLRVGFFLGFDDSTRQPCVVRGAHAVTIVRADLAFAELTADGQSLARTETDRLRAWLDDREGLEVPGEGPRGVAGAASFDNAQPPPEPWQRALDAAAVRSRFGQCHTEGVARGAAPEGRVVVRLNVESRTGRIRRADVALSSLGDDEEAACVARALGAAQLGPGPSGWAEVVDLSVPVRLVVE
jgi:hypothetical protein